MGEFHPSFGAEYTAGNWYGVQVSRDDLKSGRLLEDSDEGRGILTGERGKGITEVLLGHALQLIFRNSSPFTQILDCPPLGLTDERSRGRGLFTSGRGSFFRPSYRCLFGLRG